MGRGGGQVVSVLAYYSDDLSTNPAEAYSFFYKIFAWKDRNKQREAGVSPLKIVLLLVSWSFCAWVYKLC